MVWKMIWKVRAVHPLSISFDVVVLELFGLFVDEDIYIFWCSLDSSTPGRLPNTAVSGYLHMYIEYNTKSQLFKGVNDALTSNMLVRNSGGYLSYLRRKMTEGVNRTS